MANTSPVHAAPLTFPAKNAVSLDSQFSNTVDLTNAIKAFRVGTTAGDVKVITVGGNTVTIPSVQIGETISLQVTRIFATGTAATGLTGFYD